MNTQTWRAAVLALATAAGLLLPLAARADADLSTFRAFGEKPGLVRIMDDFMVALLADPRTRPFFENANQTRVKEQLVEQICAVLEGPCKYEGAPMGPLHASMGIRQEHFNALVEDLQIAMDKNAVPFRAQNKLLARLAPLHREIITR